MDENALNPRLAVMNDDPQELNEDFDGSDIEMSREAAELPATGSLTKAELAELLFERVGLNKREAKDMVESFFDELSTALVRGESVKLSGFGNFLLRDKAQRPGRNPKTGESIPISARRVVTFHASQKLKAQIDEAGREGGPIGEPQSGDLPAGALRADDGSSGKGSTGKESTGGDRSVARQGRTPRRPPDEEF